MDAGELLLASGTSEFSANAILMGDRIDLRALGSQQRYAGGPLVLSVRGGGAAVLFRYGALCLFDVKPLEEDAFLRELQPRVQNPSSDRERETLQVRIDPDAKELMEGSCVLLKDASAERLQIVADVLCKSVVLARYEQIVSQTFDRIEPFAANLDTQGLSGKAASELLKHLGSTLLMEQQMVGRLQLDDTPELLWDHPTLERLFLRVRDEFELVERAKAVNRKLELISRTVQTALELLQTGRSHRVEWYIVGLICFEILLTLFEKLWGVTH
ncbi:protein of unknown function DUF155 [Pirellula staleyi DSM 6068]|uniref:DUF155 domain-containing protein n=1 Tax=Pirellula staleyi (strain ATCC 27377 / DSM 6068 / ICPB 4128) TaxID=530564 RepID=D2R1V8_PIRSD|nr:RMD1 family protein [Pirellula staleyi]ADB16827.1 protein of unknown function DUF155 [Pirellula staleyi DSM 6068]